MKFPQKEYHAFEYGATLFSLFYQVTFQYFQCVTYSWGSTDLHLKTVQVCELTPIFFSNRGLFCMGH